MTQSLLSAIPSASGLHLSSLYISRRPRFALLLRSVDISASAHAHRLPALRAMQPSGPDAAPPSQDDAKVANSGAGSSKGPNLPNFPLPNIPPWAKWVLGSLVLVALPFYKRILRIEGQVERTAETVVEVVEKMAEMTDKVAEEVGEALPEGSLKQLALKVEKMAEVVDKDAELVESLIQKVDKIVDEVDAMVEPIIEGGEAISKSGPQR